MLPPILEVYVVWHPRDTAGAGIAETLLQHFHGKPFSGLIGGAVELFARSVGWSGEDDSPRPLPLGAAPEAHELKPAAFVAIVPLVGDAMALATENVGAWRDYMQGLVVQHEAQPERVLLLPYALKPSALNGTVVGAILSKPLRIAANPLQDGDEAVGLLCRDLAQGLAQLMGPKEPIRVFVSHTKHSAPEDEEDAAALTASIRAVIGQTRLRDFFDARDLQPGEDWATALSENAAKGALLAVRTDLYPSREWCQREMMLAKNHGVPIVIVDALGRAEERGSFLMDHLPRVPVRLQKGKWSTTDIYRALNMLVDECLKRVLWSHQQRLSAARDDIAWWAPHAPEPLTLLNWLQKNGDVADNAGPIIRILHPDPPLGRDERGVLEDLLALRGKPQSLDIMTPRMLAARGG